MTALPLRARRPASLTEVVRSGLCSGCGLCASLAGPAKITMGLNMKGNSRPLVVGELDERTHRTILDVCPGANLTGPGRPAGAKTHSVWGPIREMHRAWSAEPAVRHHAAAGGTLSGLGRYLIGSGEVDAILHVRASATTPWLTEAMVSRTTDEVYGGAQSRYGPSAPLVHVKQLLDEGERFAVVAKPCDISAVRALARVDPRVDRQVRFLLTNFCGGVFNAQVARAMIRFHGGEEAEVDAFRFRGEGWPGPHRVQTKDGRTFDLSYESAYKDRPWGYDMQFRCKICPDGVGESADISVPDAWILKDGRPVYDEAPGVNVAVVRTERGRDLLARAAGAGYLELSSISMTELEQMHGNHPARKVGAPAAFTALRVLGQPARKVGAPAAFTALRVLGQPAPRVTGYRPLASLRRAGWRVSFQQFAGTVRRVLKRDNREPVI